MKKYNKGFSTILIIFIVGFLTALTTGVFGLVLNESNDTKNMELYLKALSGAEGAVELGLLKSKEFNNTYNGTLDKNTPLGEILFNTSKNNKRSNVKISYDIDSTSSGILNKGLDYMDTDLIPLYIYDDGGEKKSINISLILKDKNGNVINDTSGNYVAWNIIGQKEGLFGLGSFDFNGKGNLKTIDEKQLFRDGNDINSEKENISLNENYSIREFLAKSNRNFLIIQNISDYKEPVYYDLDSKEKITKYETTITGVGEIGTYKQNIVYRINNAEYFNGLKYSIFSPSDN